MDAAAGTGAPEGTRIVRLVVPPGDVELASDALWQRGPHAVHEEPQADGTVRLTADVADVDGLDRLGARWPVEVLEIDGDGYLDAWRAWARPVRAGRRFVLQPAWLEAPPSADGHDLMVLLDPGRAFGSGSHPSTRLVLALMEDLVEADASVLDVGTGSGVLAVAACLLGAASVVAVDVDAAAVEATERNARANDVVGRITVSTTPVADVVGAFDLVVANIGAAVLGDLADVLVASVRPGGHLVLAGLLAEQADAVVARFSGAVERERRAEAGWMAVALEVPVDLS